jgi:hypothetical protein
MPAIAVDQYDAMAVTGTVTWRTRQGARSHGGTTAMRCGRSSGRSSGKNGHAAVNGLIRGPAPEQAFDLAENTDFSRAGH